MPIDSSSDVETIRGRGFARTSLTDGHESIENGVSTDLFTETGAPETATLYIDTNGAVDLTIEFSPDGERWVEPAGESPIAFDAAGQDVAFIDYDAAAIRITASNTTGVNLDIRVTA